eukprot:TRINITY_DN3318_c0_g1_i2.p1 TRINITY_DN3318_c0_g1~~TRINITY_DN3318_c0_g1_i2.p1  ORF type:complete len:362 (+),score=30.74 TRINITY_DN3318_c0_g1_i2:87-1172(+)
MAGRCAAFIAALGSSLFSLVVAGSDKCQCIFHGKSLPEVIYTKYPEGDKGKYKDLQGIKLYGTTCGAWDQMPGMPWSDSCPPGANWTEKKYNWCQVPWCYVDKDCPDAMPSSVFKGSNTVAFYAYSPCGGAVDCFTDVYQGGDWSGTWPAGCPYDPSGKGSYDLSEGGDCACIFQGQHLSAGIYKNYPDKSPAGCTTGQKGNCDTYPGMYEGLKSTKYYGTACAAWDQQPETPWYRYCPVGADWCHHDYNWCVAPWCYVSKNCKTAIPTSTFNGSDVLTYFSYDTCLRTPNCLTDVAWNRDPAPPEQCPFDAGDNQWDTRQNCSAGWTNRTIDKLLSGTLRMEAKVASVVLTMAALLLSAL